MADGFLGRWARRKADAREGKPLDEPVHAPAAPVSVPAVAVPAPPVVAASRAEPAGEPPAPPPTLEDARQLTPEADFRRFVARDVPPEVRNTAVKKLFADPHFNVMDGLDIYIDDYNKPDPLPAGMLRQMASAQFLGFFRDEADKASPAAPDSQRDAAAAAEPDSSSPPERVATPAGGPTAPASQDDHAHSDLRLQPDDASRRESAGHRTA